MGSSRLQPPLELPWLSPLDSVAYARLQSEVRRADWLAGRLAAKLAVCEAVGSELEPAEVSIAYAPGGRPLPCWRGRPLGLWLSISHSNGYGLAAASRGRRPIGVDLEVSSKPVEGLIDYALDATERARLPASIPPCAALVCWTLKEAALKALGTGLRVHPRHAHVEADYEAPRGQASWHVTAPSGPAGAGRAWFQQDGGLTCATAVLDRWS
jgi:4'-phosphopantetheinyl transferase